MAAAMSDPDRNPAFHRRWQEPPTQVRPIPAVVNAGPDPLGPLGLALLEAWHSKRPDRNQP